MYGFHGDGDSYQGTIISLYPISTVSYILKLNDFFFCLSELIEELARATDLKFGMRVEYVLSRNKF